MKIIDKIKCNGYMTHTQISIEISDTKKLKEFLVELNKDPEIHKVEYTNKYVAPYTTKQLYFYNPNTKKRTKRKTSGKKKKKILSNP